MSEEEIERTQEENHDLLYSRYVMLNAFKNKKRRAPTSSSTDDAYEQGKGQLPIGPIEKTEKEEANPLLAPNMPGYDPKDQRHGELISHQKYGCDCGACLEGDKLRNKMLLENLERSIKTRTNSDSAMFLQGNCSGSGEEGRTKAYSTDKGERQEFIDKNCSTCPVKSGCLNYALEHLSDSEGGLGVWGGTHPDERYGYSRPLQEGSINPLDTRWFPEYREPQ